MSTSRFAGSILALCMVAFVAITNARAGVIFVTNYVDGQPGHGTVGKYTTSGVTLNSTFISGLNGPSGIIASGSYLLVANYGGGTIQKFDMTTGALVGTLISGLNNPSDLAISGSSLFVTNWGGGTIGEYDLNTGSPLHPALITGLNHPSSLVIDGSYLYVAVMNNNGTVSQYTLTGQTVNASLLTGFSFPTGGGLFIFGSSLFVADSGHNVVNEYTTAGTAVHVPLISSGLYYPSGIAADGSNLYIVNQSLYQGTHYLIGAYTLAGSTVNPTLISGLSSPIDMVIIPDPVPGDTDGNGYVNAADLAIVLAAMDSTAAGGGLWDARADLDSDAAVTSSDLSIVLVNMP